MRTKVILCITGACGNIAFSLYGILFNSQPFGPEIDIIVRLLDIPSKLQHLKALKLQLEDCCFKNVVKIQITDQQTQAFIDADAVIFLGSLPRKPGMDKADFLQANAQIFSRQGKILNQCAKKTCKSIVVANPVNTNCLILSKNAPSIPTKNFTSLVRLDYNRLTSQLSRMFEVPQKSIKNHIVWGNHSMNQFRDLSLLQIENINRSIVQAKLKQIDINEIAKNIWQRNSMIVGVTGAGTFLSAAKSIVDHIKDLFYGSQKIVSMGVILNKQQYEVQRSLCFSMPCLCLGNGQYRIVDDLNLNKQQKIRISEGNEELKKQKEYIKRFISEIDTELE